MYCIYIYIHLYSPVGIIIIIIIKGIYIAQVRKGHKCARYGRIQRS